MVSYLPTVIGLPAQIRSAAAGLLESSGVPELEARVLSFLGAHAAAVKMLATLDDCVRLLEQVRACVLAVYDGCAGVKGIKLLSFLDSCVQMGLRRRPLRRRANGLGDSRRQQGEGTVRTLSETQHGA